jgi:hypothetical protein
MAIRSRKRGRPRKVKAADEIRAELQQLEQVRTRGMPPAQRGPIYDRRVRLRRQLLELRQLEGLEIERRRELASW